MRSKKRSLKSSTKKVFLYNPNNPKTSFDVYINKRPEDTIPIKYSTVEDVKKTIRKLESHFKKGEYTHQRFLLAENYFLFLKKRTLQKGKTSEETFRLRKSMTFKI